MPAKCYLDFAEERTILYFMLISKAGMKRQMHNSQIADYIHLIFDTFLELRGDRRLGDDKTVISGLARLDKYEVVVVGYQEEQAAETSRAPDARGYRKSSRLLRLAEVFSKPVVLFIDIPVSSLPLASEQQTDEAMARNLEEMSCLATPIISIITGESSGLRAIEMCAADRVLMLESSSFYVLSSDDVPVDDVNAGRSYLKAQDLVALNIVDRTVKEPSGDDPKSLANAMRKAILEELGQLTQVHPEDLVQQRLDRLQRQFLNFRSFELSSGNSTAPMEG